MMKLKHRSQLQKMRKEGKSVTYSRQFVYLYYTLLNSVEEGRGTLRFSEFLTLGGTIISIFKGPYLLNCWTCSFHLYTKIIPLIWSTIQPPEKI